MDRVPKVADNCLTYNENRHTIVKQCSILREINCPYIVRAKDFIRKYDWKTKVVKLCFTYEPGVGTIQELMDNAGKRNTTLSELTVKSILFQILLATEHLHERGFCHCNICPKNILLMSDASLMPGIVKLNELSQVQDCTTRGKKTLDIEKINREYSSPRLGKDMCDYKHCDMYSIGKIAERFISISRQDSQASESEMKDLKDKLLTNITAHDALLHPYFNMRPFPVTNILGTLSKEDRDMLSRSTG